MFLKLVCLVFIGGAWTLEDKTFAHTGSIFCFDFVAKVSTGSNCSVTKDSTKTILFYDSDNHNVTEEPEYLGRVVNATFEGSGSIQFCLQGLTQTDSGTYTNNCSSSSGIPLTVIDLISDVTIEQPFTKPAIAGNNYSLRCTVAPPTANVINISWLFVNNLTQIVENDNFKFRGDKREVFEILDVKQSFMSAHFMCSAISVLGQKKDSQQYSLYIVVKPEVQLNEKTISAVIGQPFFTDCRATGFPSPSVQWTKNNTVVPQIRVSDSYSILVIQNVTSVTNAIYTCLANVSYGSLILQANESFTLQPYGPPNPPTGVRVAVSSSQSAELRWVADMGVNQHYVSAYHVLNRQVFHYNSPESEINGTYYQKLEDLEEGTEYEAFVFARNDAGDSKKVFVKFKTSEQQFFESLAYKYTVFSLSIFVAFSLVVLLTVAILRTVQRSPSICMEKMPETFEMDRVLEKRKVSENTEVKQEKCFENHPDDECSEKPPVKSQHSTTGGDPQAQSLYEDITEDVTIKNIPKMPTKSNSIKKIHSEPVLSKNKKYTDKTVAKRRDPPAEPNDAPLEYSSLRAKSVGPAVYEEMTIDRPSGGKAKVIIKDSDVYANTILSEEFEEDERL
eukprot:XP_011450428.1 PREDICTED: uncharacterized protein LOC105344361 isoform X2 [Crassostrea gigas]